MIALFLFGHKLLRDGFSKSLMIYGCTFETDELQFHKTAVS